jgi:hypothetical protein
MLVCMVAICSYRLIFFVFSLVLDENRIVYEWTQLAGKLRSRSGGTPKEEDDPCLYFLCRTADNCATHVYTGYQHHHGLEVTP